MTAQVVGVPTLITDTATVATGRGHMLGFYVAATNAGTLVFHDATGATNAVTGTITPAVGWHALPLAFNAGLHVVKGGTSISVTIVHGNG